MGKSTLGIWLGIKTVESLRKDFHIEIPEFSVETGYTLSTHIRKGII